MRSAYVEINTWQLIHVSIDVPFSTLTKMGSKSCWEMPQLWSHGMVLTGHLGLQGFGSSFYAILWAMKILPGLGGVQPWWFNLEHGLDNLHHSKGQLENISKDENWVYSWQHQDQTPDSVRLIMPVHSIGCEIRQSRLDLGSVFMSLANLFAISYPRFFIWKIELKTKVFNCLLEENILLFIIHHPFHIQSLKCIHQWYELLVLWPLPSHLK